MDLGKLKQLLGITTADQDALLQFCIDSITETIKDYCHVETIPGGVLNTAYRMAVDLYRNENIGDTGLSPGIISGQSMGDVSISYREDLTYTQSLLKNYRAMLSRYRKLKW